MAEYFRGQSDIRWNIEPSIVRLLGSDSSRTCESDYIKKAMRTGLFDKTDFQTSSNDLHKSESSKTITRIRVLSKMQHYGFSTRLIDITRNENIALYFASNMNFDFDGVVYKLVDYFDNRSGEKGKQKVSKSKSEVVEYVSLKVQPNEYKVNVCFDGITTVVESDMNNINRFMQHTLIDNEKLGLKDVSIVLNKRMKNQEGAFIICGNKVEGNKILEMNSENINRDLFLKHDVIKKERKIEVLANLASTGIHYAFIYPDSEKTVNAFSNLISFFNETIYTKNEYFETAVINFIIKTFKSININCVSSNFTESKEYLLVVSEIYLKLRSSSANIKVFEELLLFAFCDYSNYISFKMSNGKNNLDEIMSFNNDNVLVYQH